MEAPGFCFVLRIFSLLYIGQDLKISVDCGEYKTSRKQSSILDVFICFNVIFLHLMVVPNAILEYLLKIVDDDGYGDDNDDNDNDDDNDDCDL